MIKTCICGRVGEHCPNADCGSISKWPLKQRTTFMSRQTGLDIRYFTCRKCGVEYAWFNGKLYDGECYAPKEVRISAAPKNLEQEVKDINECIQFLALRGGVVDFPNGIKDPSEDSTKVVEPKAPIEPKPELIIRKVDPEPVEQSDAFSLDDLFKKKEPPKDENNP